MRVESQDSAEKPTLGRRSADNALRKTLDVTAAVGRRLEEFLGDRLELLYLLYGMLPNGSARILAELGPKQTGQDHAIVFHSSRLATTVVSAYELLRLGLIGDAHVLTRSAFEVATQAVVFMEKPALAERWMAGTSFAPRAIRAELGDPMFGEMYAWLSNLSHANPDARWLHATATDVGYAVHYGGSYQPKRVAALLGFLMLVALQYLSAFDRLYRERLSIEGWPILLLAYWRILDDFNNWWMALPDDRIELVDNYAKRRSEASGVPQYPDELRASLRRAVREWEERRRA